MKTTSITTPLAFGILLSIGAVAGQSHRYDIRSAKILYEIKGAANIMGVVQTKTKGQKRLIFDQYGAKEVIETAKVTQETKGGNTKVNKEHTLIYLNGGIVYQADFLHKRITRMANPTQALGALFGGGKSLTQTGEAMLRQMGGKKIGTDTVLGYTCDVWQAMGTTQCLYHGIALRVHSDIMGVKQSETAIKAQFNLQLSPASFKLPDFPITDAAGAPLNLDRHRLDQIDAKASRRQEKNMQEGAEAMKAAFAAAAAHQGESPDAQEAAIAKAMLPIMQQKFKQQKAELIQTRNCLQHATTLAQARRCNPRPEEGEAPIPTWNRAEKSQTLHQIDVAIQGMECTTKARSMKEMEACFQEGR
jgi:hypothetical protein